MAAKASARELLRTTESIILAADDDHERRKKQRLLNNVHAYAELAQEQGYIAAAREYMAEDAVMIVENHALLKGRDAICAHLATLADMTIT